MSIVTIESMEFALVYASDFSQSITFYEKYFGFTKAYDMPDGSCFGKAGNINIWISANYNKVNTNEQSARLSVMFRINSAFKLFEQLTKDQIKIYQTQPQEMQPGNYWFQFEDPSGNIIEVLGKK